MRRLLKFGILAIVLTGIPAKDCTAQIRYFPDSTFARSAGDHFVSDWYSRQLVALKEPSLFESSEKADFESYRFVWLRTFHHPVSVRVDVNHDGTGKLTTKIASGAGGYDPGHLTTNDARRLSKEETQKVIALIRDSDFWQLPPFGRKDPGMDGSEWVFEGAVHGKYHAVSEWTPGKGTIYKLGKFFLFDLDKMEIPRREFY